MVKDSEMLHWVRKSSMSDVSYLSASTLLRDKYFLFYSVRAKVLLLTSLSVTSENTNNEQQQKIFLYLLTQIKTLIFLLH